MALTNKERVGRALDQVLEGLRPRCEETWKSFYGDGWLDKLREFDHHSNGTLDDLSFLLKSMHATWQPIWRHQFNQADRSYSSELRDIRNKWAHGDAFTYDDAYRALDTAERVLTSFSATEQAAIVQASKIDLLRQNLEAQARDKGRKSAAQPTAGEPLHGLPSWRDVIVPHDDVASGQFEQAEFAADLHQVVTGNASVEYLDPEAFFARTYLTNGLKELLERAAKRLSGQGGDPVIDLQTNFGGGKTHSMIALYHLASGVDPAVLRGVGDLFDENDLSLPSSVARAVVVGQWLSPASPTTKPDGTVIHTVWGDIAWQLGGAAGYELVREDDLAGTNPGAKLHMLLKQVGPCIILIDEWVAYARQLPSRDNEPPMCGGHFDTQFTFAQTLTEAVAAVPNAVLLVSIPASDIEVGGDKGQDALARLSNVVRRKSAQWKPAEDDESFEIVRRRLFKPMNEEQQKARDRVVNAFCDYYQQEHMSFPRGVSEADYRRRMILSYPIHPELFDRLYQDWSSLDRFQRTRGVLRLMATVISELWQRDDKNLMILPGTIPLDEQRVNSELTKYLEPGWDPVIRTDVDGGNSTPLKIDQSVTNLGQYSATRRVARAVYLASAPREESRRGIDLKLLTLGSAQPGEAPGRFHDAVRRLSNEAQFLYVDGQRYWYSLKPNISRMANDRAESKFNDADADDELLRRLQGERDKGPFIAVHLFPEGPGDVVDEDDGARLVVLPPSAAHTKGSGSKATDLAETILSQRNAGPRINRNLLLFVAATEARVNELRAATRQYLAWQSILSDFAQEQIDLTHGDQVQAKSKLDETSSTVDHQLREAFQNILVPTQVAGHRDIKWTASKPSGDGSLAVRVGRRLASDEALITTYGGVRVRMNLDGIPLWSDRKDKSVGELWQAYCQFLYLPTLASFDVLSNAISDGVGRVDISDTFAYAEGHDDERWVGLGFGSGVAATRSGFVVAPDAAQEQLAADQAKAKAASAAAEPADPSGSAATSPGGAAPASPPAGGSTPASASAAPQSESITQYFAQFEIDPVRGIRQLEDIMTHVIEQLNRANGSTVKLSLEIEASAFEFDDAVQRTVKENASQLKVKNQDFE